MPSTSRSGCQVPGLLSPQPGVAASGSWGLPPPSRGLVGAGGWAPGTGPRATEMLQAALQELFHGINMEETGLDNND